MSNEAAVNEEKVGEFVGKVMGDASATMTTILAVLGDRLGLFKDLAAHGPATPAELAERTSTDERYMEEWLGGMLAAGYVEHDAASSKFSLPAEHAPALAQEGGPFFFGGVYHMLPHLVGVLGPHRSSVPRGRWRPSSHLR